MGTTLLKKLKEHFENTSDLNVKKNMLDIYTDRDRAMSWEQKDVTSLNGNKSFQPTVGLIV